jgi:hypothetical protein
MSARELLIMRLSNYISCIGRIVVNNLAHHSKNGTEVWFVIDVLNQI